MRIAFVIYDGLTTLDFIGAYDALYRLKTMGFIPDLEWDVCATSREVRDGVGLVLLADRVGQPLAGYDLVYLPGGPGSRTLAHDPDFIAWLKTAAGCPLKVSVCTGSLLLGAAGFLQGRAATTHPQAYDLLAPYCGRVSQERIVDAGEVITGRGVASSLDLGLYLCAKLAGPEARERIGRQMDYPGGP